MTHNNFPSDRYIYDMTAYIALTSCRRGRWNQAVASYANFLWESYVRMCWKAKNTGQPIPELTPVTLLQGKRSWAEYSQDGYALTEGADIAKQVFTPKKFAKWESGRKVTDEPLVDIQTRALVDACKLVMSAKRYAGMCANLQNRQPDEK